MRRAAALLALWLATAGQGAWSQAIAVRDDLGRRVELQGPVKRIVSLAPHATELLFAAGGGPRIVGVDRQSDYPAAARALPKVGDGLQIDIERILALKPDLLVLWSYGETPGGDQRLPLGVLRELGVAVYYSRPLQLNDIPEAIGRLGKLLGTSGEAEAAAGELRRRLRDLERRYAARRPVRVFYQLGSNPIYTVNGRSIISHALTLCGAVNVFAALPAAAPMVGTESVLVENPQAIIAGGAGAAGQALLASWKRYAPGLAAAALDNLWSVDADRMNRPGPRMIDETAKLCGDLDAARKRAYPESGGANGR